MCLRLEKLVVDLLATLLNAQPADRSKLLQQASSTCLASKDGALLFVTSLLTCIWNAF